MGFPAKLCLKRSCCNKLYKYRTTLCENYQPTITNCWSYKLEYNIVFPNCPEVAIFIFILLVRRQPMRAGIQHIRIYILPTTTTTQTQHRRNDVHISGGKYSFLLSSSAFILHTMFRIHQVYLCSWCPTNTQWDDARLPTQNTLAAGSVSLCKGEEE